MAVALEAVAAATEGRLHGDGGLAVERLVHPVEARGADDALLLNTAGRLACASAANLFLVRGRRLLTPPPGEGVLPGITRAEVIALAADLDLAVTETPLEPDQLRSADEAFLTNSLMQIRPLVAVNDRPLGDGAAGPVTRQLLGAYQEA